MGRYAPGAQDASRNRAYARCRAFGHWREWCSGGRRLSPAMRAELKEKRMSTNGYANSGSLVETEWVAARLGDPTLRFVEVDVDTSAYGTGHLSGAIGWNWQVDLQ